MIFTIENVLTSEELEWIASCINLEDFVDGQQTAGWHARQVKRNTQLSPSAPSAQKIQQIVQQALHRNALFQSAVQPRTVHSLLVSRYEAGMGYGSHVDNALMGSSKARSDVSFTVFLSAPEDYQGGELVIEASDGDRTFKLPQGWAIVYPSSYLHRVETVSSGVRLVTVGWVQSFIRDPAERELLFDLDAVRRSIFARDGKTTEFDLLSKTYANLLRKWMD